MSNDTDLSAAIQTYVANDIRYITFNRPQKLNALTAADLVEVTRLVTEAPGNARAIVFTGTRVFSAGMHTASFEDLDPEHARHLIGHVRDCVGAVRTTPIPTVAMINGYCLGAAFELALACDMRVAADHAQFGLPEVKVGVPSVVDAALLQEHVGLTMAKEIILTGDLYSATELFGLRLLNRMVPLEQLHDETLSLLAKVTRHTTTVLASQKRLFETWLNSSLQDGIDASVEEFARVFEMAETREQVRKYRSLAGRR